MYEHKSDHPLIGLQVIFKNYPATVTGTGSVSYIWLTNRLGFSELIDLQANIDVARQIPNCGKCNEL